VKTITIRELHNRTGALVRNASRHGEIHVTDNGRVVAKIVALTEPPRDPYFARRKPSTAFKKLDASRKTGTGTDVTQAVSEDRD
jgi:antitoxin (DNA-binding transcriptional repressor) of toxin-antitoxin stability system